MVSDLTKERRKQLDDAYKYHQLLRDISEEETWIREKKVLVQSQVRLFLFISEMCTLYKSTQRKKELYIELFKVLTGEFVNE